VFLPQGDFLAGQEIAASKIVLVLGTAAIMLFYTVDWDILD